jgi:hypothetical protein
MVHINRNLSLNWLNMVTMAVLETMDNRCINNNPISSNNSKVSQQTIIKEVSKVSKYLHPKPLRTMDFKALEANQLHTNRLQHLLMAAVELNLCSLLISSNKLFMVAPLLRQIKGLVGSHLNKPDNSKQDSLCPHRIIITAEVQELNSTDNLNKRYNYI